MTDVPKHFAIYKDGAGEWRWTLYALNNKKLADSGEGYATKQGCVHGINLVKAAAAGTDIWNRESREWE